LRVYFRYVFSFFGLDVFFTIFLALIDCIWSIVGTCFTSGIEIHARKISNHAVFPGEFCCCVFYCCYLSSAFYIYCFGRWWLHLSGHLYTVFLSQVIHNFLSGKHSPTQLLKYVWRLHCFC